MWEGMIAGVVVEIAEHNSDLTCFAAFCWHGLDVKYVACCK